MIGGHMAQILRVALLAVITCANSWACAQTKIELAWTFTYTCPKNEPVNVGERKLTNNPWERVSQRITLTCFLDSKGNVEDDTRDKSYAGSVRVQNYVNNKTTKGWYSFIYNSDEYSGIMEMWFPAVKKIKKIEFLNKNNNKMFEDVFEEVQFYNFEISRVSPNSFSVPSQSRAFISLNGAKTWSLLNVNRNNNISINSDAINNPDTVVVVMARDPNPPYGPGVALWAPNPSDYVLEFADDEEPTPLSAPTTNSSTLQKNSNSSKNNPSEKKSLLSRISGK